MHFMNRGRFWIIPLLVWASAPSSQAIETCLTLRELEAVVARSQALMSDARLLADRNIAQAKSENDFPRFLYHSSFQLQLKHPIELARQIHEMPEISPETLEKTVEGDPNDAHWSNLARVISSTYREIERRKNNGVYYGMFSLTRPPSFLFVFPSGGDSRPRRAVYYIPDIFCSVTAATLQPNRLTRFDRKKGLGFIPMRKDPGRIFSFAAHLAKNHKALLEYDSSKMDPEEYLLWGASGLLSNDDQHFIIPQQFLEGTPASGP